MHDLADRSRHRSVDNPGHLPWKLADHATRPALTCPCKFSRAGEKTRILLVEEKVEKFTLRQQSHVCQSGTTRNSSSLQALATRRGHEIKTE